MTIFGTNIWVLYQQKGSILYKNCRLGQATGFLFTPVKIQATIIQRSEVLNSGQDSGEGEVLGSRGAASGGASHT